LNITATPIEFHVAVDAEEAAQFVKWGEQNHPDGTNESNKVIADAARAACEEAARNGHLTWKDIALEEFMEALAEEDEDALISELIQTAAVIKSWIKAIQRRQQVAA
jgi:hypothetical protein